MRWMGYAIPEMDIVVPVGQGNLSKKIGRKKKESASDDVVRS